MNPYMIELMIREKREDMLREAERQRLVAQYEAGRVRAKTRFALALGDVLISLGERLKSRYGQKSELPCCEPLR